MRKFQPTTLSLLLLAACSGPSFGSDTTRDPAVTPPSDGTPSTGLDGASEAQPLRAHADVLGVVDGEPAPTDDEYVGLPDEGELTEEWLDRLGDRELDYGAALRTASLRLRGDLPSLVETRIVTEAPDPEAAYEAMVDLFLEDPRFTTQVLAFWRDTMKMGGSRVLDSAPVFATQLVIEDRPFTSLFNAPSGNCPTFDGDTGEFTAAECDNGAPAQAGVLTNTGVQRHFYSNLAFRRTRWVQETFACDPFPTEFGTPTSVGADAPYTAPWPWESFSGTDNGGRVDFHDTESVICGNCHATMNHIAPLFGRFDEDGMWNDGFVVTLPLEGLPEAQMSDWLPPGETPAWRFGVPTADLPALGAAMAVDPEVARCMTARVWNWALGRGDAVVSLAVVPRDVSDALLETYFGAGYRLKAVIRHAYTSDDFVRF